MKIVVDDKIPYINDALRELADEVVSLPGARISAADVHDADALIVRTRTRCDAALLDGSRVRFVATATIGFDHIDTEYMRAAGVEWMNCPGCNAASVAQYVQSALTLMRREKGLDLRGMTIGVVGCGHVGSKVARVALDEGMRVMVCDPPREIAGQTETYEPCGVKPVDGIKPVFVSLDTIMRECDVITFHTPLTRSGRYGTLHLADEAFFNGLERRPVVINTSRGAVVDNQALKAAIMANKVSAAVIDTWENEPNIDLDLDRKSVV